MSTGSWKGMICATARDRVYLSRGVITERGTQVYTEGECWVLALQLHHMTGWPLALIRQDKSDNWYHVAVQAPDGRVLDVNGLRNADEALQDYRSIFTVVTWSVQVIDGSQVPGRDASSIPARFAERTQQVAEHLLDSMGAPIG